MRLDERYKKRLFRGYVAAAMAPAALFVAFQKYLTQGISTTGLKG